MRTASPLCFEGQGHSPHMFSGSLCQNSPGCLGRSRFVIGWIPAQMLMRTGRPNLTDDGIDLSIEPVCFSNTKERKTNLVRVLWGANKKLILIQHAKKRVISDSLFKWLPRLDSNQQPTG